jgi:glycosyltransferase involved in cell wall biosynthesis
MVMHHLAQAWHRCGHEVRVFNADTGEAASAAGQYTVRRCPVLRGATRFGYHRFPWGHHTAWATRRLLDDFRPDFFSVHHGYPGAVWASMMRPVPRYFVTCHGVELTKLPFGDRARYRIDGVLSRALRAAAGVFAISSMAHRLIAELGVPEARIHDVPNGVDLARFQRPSSFDLRAALGIPAGAPVVLSVGRDHPQKAYGDGLAAFARARLPEGTRYVLLGKGVDTWRPLADRLGVGARVVFHPGLFGEDLAGAYQQADVFFLPSIWELHPLVLLEAMAAGCPAVVTDVSGAQDMIADGVNGRVVPPGDVDGLAAALTALTADEGLRGPMGAENRARAEAYGWDRIAARYLEHAGRG